jgi:hypothetical protein
MLIKSVIKGCRRRLIVVFLPFDRKRGIGQVLFFYFIRSEYLKKDK